MKTKNLFYLCVVSFTLAFFIYCLSLLAPPTALSEIWWELPEDVQAMPDWIPNTRNNLIYKTQRYNFFEAWPSQDGISSLYTPWKTPTLSYEPVWAQGAGYLGSSAYPFGGGWESMVDTDFLKGGTQSMVDTDFLKGGM